MAVAPAAAKPMPNPAMPCSHNGVLKTRSFPYFSCKPTVQRKTPPKATSSPKITVLLSVAHAMSIAFVMDCNKVIFSISPKKFVKLA